jgi:hypothetical protein
LVLSFNIQDVILLADYNFATEPSTVTCSEAIGVEAEELTDLQVVVEDSEDVDKDKV